MVGSFVLLVLAPAAPAPKETPPVEVTAKPYTYPPQLVPGPAGPVWYNIDDGKYLKVTVKNTSREVISIPYASKVRERVTVKVTDADGAEVSDTERQIKFRRAKVMSQVHELRPGESLTVIAHLEENWSDDADRRRPGKYTIRVLFESGKLRAESAAFEVEITK